MALGNTFSAPFVQTYRTGSAVATLALAGLTTDVVTGAVLLGTAGINGAVFTKLTAMPRGTVTATALMLFIVKADGLYRYKDSEAMPAYTAGVTIAVPETSFTNISDDTPIRLEAGDKLYVGTQIAWAAGVVFAGEWGDL